MSSINSIKRRIGIIINKSAIRPLFEKLNLFFCHWPDRLHSEHPGTEKKDILVIRPQTDTQGLLSSYLYVLKNVRWAWNRGYDPYVDFENAKCQYYTGEEIHGSKNAWEYYFEQPSCVTKETINKAGTVFYSGWSISKRNIPIPIPKRPEVIDDQEILSIVHSCPVKQYIKDIVEQKYLELFSGNVLGVFIRGTDYVKLEPKGHARQPQIEAVINKIQEFIDEYPIDKVFVVTEDFDYYSMIRNRFGDKVFSSDDYFINNYGGDKYVGAAFTNGGYERGLNYLIRILLFGRCDYTIAGITNGSVVANMLREKKPIKSYWFDLGVY